MSILIQFLSDNIVLVVLTILSILFFILQMDAVWGVTA